MDSGVHRWYNDFAVVEKVDTGGFPLKPDGIMSGANPDPHFIIGGATE